MDIIEIIIYFVYYKVAIGYIKLSIYNRKIAIELLPIFKIVSPAKYKVKNAIKRKYIVITIEYDFRSVFYMIAV